MNTTYRPIGTTTHHEPSPGKAGDVSVHVAIPELKDILERLELLCAAAIAERELGERDLEKPTPEPMKVDLYPNITIEPQVINVEVEQPKVQLEVPELPIQIFPRVVVEPSIVVSIQFPKGQLITMTLGVYLLLASMIFLLFSIYFPGFPEIF